MNIKQLTEFYEKELNFLKALSNPTRLEILNIMIKKGSITSSELADMIDVSDPTIYGCLRYLYRVGILNYRNGDSQTKIYYIKDERVSKLLSLLKEC